MTDQPTPPQPAVAVLTRDLFFGMRIRNALKQMGYETDLQKSEAAFAESLASPDCALALIDLNTDVDWDALRPVIEGHPALAVIAFGAHTDADAFRTARAAGVTRVVSNGAFSQQLPELVERYLRKD